MEAAAASALSASAARWQRAKQSSRDERGDQCVALVEQINVCSSVVYKTLKNSLTNRLLVNSLDLASTHYQTLHDLLQHTACILYSCILNIMSAYDYVLVSTRIK